jgi:sugar phosphate isomerase/epimerase
MSETHWALCLNTSTIRPASLEDKIAIAAETGYAAVELWSDDLTSFEKRGGSLPEVKQRVSDAGLRIPSVIALFDWMQTKEANKDAAFAEVRRRMQQAASIGAPYIVASPVPDAPNLDIGCAAAAYHQLLELGKEIGVTPAMEFLGFFRNVFQLEQAVAIAQQAGHPKACIVLDPFHLYRGGSGFGGIKLLKGVKIAICHFNDAPATPPQFEQADSDRVYPGDGILPLAEMLRDLASIGYADCLSVELFNERYWQQDPRAVARNAREKAEAITAASVR